MICITILGIDVRLSSVLGPMCGIVLQGGAAETDNVVRKDGVLRCFPEL